MDGKEQRARILRSGPVAALNKGLSAQSNEPIFSDDSLPSTSQRRDERIDDADSTKTGEAASVKSDVITTSKNTGYIHPLSAEGIKAYQRKPKERTSQRLIVPPPKGRNAAQLQPNCAPQKNPFVKALPRYIPTRQVLNGGATTRLFAEAAAKRDDNTATIAQQPSNRLSDPHHMNAPLKNGIIAPTCTATVKEEQDSDEALATKFIAVDVPDDGNGKTSVKMEIEDPIEAPDDQPLRYMGNTTTIIRPEDQEMDEKRMLWYKRRREELQLKTAEYWNATVRKTLSDCTDSIRKNVDQDKSSVVQDLVYVMAEFLKPALTRLEEMEHQKQDPEFSHTWTNQKVLDTTSAKIMETTSRLEAGSYSLDLTPIVKFTRAFATFADRFAKISQDLIQFVDPFDELIAGLEDDPLPNYDDDNNLSGYESPSSPPPDRPTEPTDTVKHFMQMVQEKRRFMKNGEVNGAGAKTKELIEIGSKKRKTAHAFEPTQEQGLKSFDDDGSLLCRRRINEVSLKSTMTLQKRTPCLERTFCPYCDDELATENLLIEHVKRLHFENWKSFAPYACRFKPHCDFRAIDMTHLEEHTGEIHDDLYREWIEDRRMTLDGMTCPFCDMSMYNIHHMHDHLEQKHSLAMTNAFKRHFPFIGCGSCTYSSFWAHDVYKHWRDKRNSCTAKMVLRQSQRARWLQQTEELRPAIKPRPGVPNQRPVIKVVRPNFSNGTVAHSTETRLLSGARYNLQPPEREVQLPGRIRIPPTGQTLCGMTKRVAPTATTSQHSEPSTPGTSADDIPPVLFKMDFEHEERMSPSQFSYDPTTSSSIGLFDEDRIKKEEEFD